MKWFILSLSVLLYSSTFVSCFNFDIPSSLLEQRTKYDYDLRRFKGPSSTEVEYDKRDSIQHDPPKKPYRPVTGIDNDNNEADSIKGFAAPSIPFKFQNYDQTTTASPVRPIPPANQASLQYQAAPEYQALPASSLSGSALSHGSFNQQDYHRTTTPSSPVGSPETTAKPSGINSQLLSSLAGEDFEVKYKETETDYYDFNESDLKRPQYDLNASRQLFEEFIQKYGKTYTDKRDEDTHYQHFVNSLKTINSLNKEGGSASFDINIMSDEDPNFFGK